MKPLPLCLLGILFSIQASGQNISLSVDSEWTLPVSSDAMRPFADGHSGARTVLGPHDLDGDSNPEILVSDYTGGGRVHVLELNAGSWQHVASTPWLDNSASTNDARTFGAGDMDGDGWGEVYILTGFGFDSGSPYGPGLFVFEMTADNTFPAAPTFIHDFQPDLPDRWRAEQITVEDIDGDTVQELIFANNGANNDYDNWYVLSFVGDIGSGSESVVQELRLSSRSAQAFDPVDRGGGSPYGSVPADLDGDGTPELALQSWFNLNFTNVDVSGPNTYVAPGGGDPNVFFRASASDDVALFGCRSFDLNGDGDDEVLCPSLNTGHVSVLNYESGESSLEVVSDNVALDVIPNLSRLGLAVADLDANGTPDLIGSGPSYGASNWTAGESPTWVAVSSFLGGDPESPGSFETVHFPAQHASAHFAFQTVRHPDGSVTYENGGEGPTFASKIVALGDIDGDGRGEFAVSFQGIEDYLNVSDDDGLGNRTWVSGTPNPHRTFLRIFEAGSTGPVAVRQIQEIDPANIAQLNSGGPGIDTGAIPGLIFNGLVGSEVTFDAVVLTDPRSSGLANLTAGQPQRIHVYVRGLAGTSNLASVSRSVQLVDGDYTTTGLINTEVGDVIRVTGLLAPFGNTMQVVPSAVTVLGDLSGLGLPPAILDPFEVTTADLNRVVGNGVQVNWSNLDRLRNEYVTLRSAEVIRSDNSLSRPNFSVSTDGGATSVTIYDASVRFRNDRGDYPPDWNADHPPFEAPPVGATVDISGFVGYYGDDPFGLGDPSGVVVNLIPFEDSDLVVLTVPPPRQVTLRLNAATIPLPLDGSEDLEIRGALDFVAPTTLPDGNVIDWSSDTSLRLTHAGGDLWESTFEVPPGRNLDFKFYSPQMEDLGIGGWEDGNNHRIPAGTGDVSLAPHFFEKGRASDEDYDWSPFDDARPNPTDVGVLFRVFMCTDDGKAVGGYNPFDTTQLMGVRGDPAGGTLDWGTSVYLAREDDVQGRPGHHLFQGIAYFDQSQIGNSQAYKFVTETAAGTGWESAANRSVTIPAQDETIHWSPFGDSPMADCDVPPQTADMTFEVNVRALELIGLFDPAEDNMQVRGSFNGWGCGDPTQCQMTAQGDGRYTLSFPMTSFPDSDHLFKFYADLDAGRFSPGAPPSGWEEPAQSGGANRSFVFTGTPTILDPLHFGDYLPGNVIPEGNALDLQFQVDMSGVSGFSPGTHKVFADIGRDEIWAYTQGLPLGHRIELLDPDGDGIYQATQPVVGPTIGAIQYLYGFDADLAATAPAGLEAGSGLNAPGRTRLQWVAPGQQGYPETYELSLDTYQPTGPLPVQQNPVRILAVDDAPSGPEDQTLVMDVLANDVDPLGTGLSIVSTTQPATGVLSMATNGQLTYQPPANFAGTDTFTYTMTDGSGQNSTATVNLTIQQVNDAPTANPDEVATEEETAVTFNVLANDTDIEQSTLLLTAVSDPTSGGVAFDLSGSVTYTPDPGFSGSESFGYVMTDGQANVNGTITVTVADINQVPVATDDVGATNEDTAVTINIVGNDSDRDGDPLTASGAGNPQHGSVTYNGDGTATYTPHLNYHGSDSFTYTVSDPLGLNDTATVTVSISPVNDPPVAVNDTRKAFEGAIADYDVRGNDSDPDGDTIQLTGASGAVGGSVSIVSGKVRYQPNVGFSGADSFTYSISDGNGLSASATVSVNVEPLPPDDDGVDDSTESQAPNGGDGNGDGIPDNEQANVASLPAASNGQFITVATEPGSELVGVVSTATNPAPEDPPAEAEFPAGFLNYALAGGTGNFERTVTITLPPGSGFNSYFKYGPTPQNTTPHWYNFLYDGQTGAIFSGNEVSLYFVDGERGDDDLTANGTIVDPGAPAIIPNKIPIAGPDVVVIPEDGVVVIDVLANDVDPDGDALTILSIGTADHGSVRRDSTGIRYQPDAEFSGTDSFTYVVSDPQGGSVVVTVSITVTEVNDLPTAVADAYTIQEDTVLLITDLLANDFDVEGSSLTLELIFAADKGLVGPTSTGEVRYSPPPDFSGEDRFRYQISDGDGTSVGEVTITVVAVNDAPIAQNDLVSIAYGATELVVDLLANDSDVEGDALTLISVTAAAHGSVVLSGDGLVTYTPGPSLQTTDTFSYTVSDGTDEATAQVTITLGSAGPLAVDDAVEIAEDEAVSIDVRTNDSDPNGDPLQVVTVRSPGHGTAILEADGLVTYTPAANFHGSDSFTYIVSDGALTDSARVAITVVPVNDAPVYDSGVLSPAADTTFVVDTRESAPPDSSTVRIAFGAAEDVDGDSLSYTWTASLDANLEGGGLTKTGALPVFEVATSDLIALVGVLASTETRTIYHRMTTSDGALMASTGIESFVVAQVNTTALEDAAIPETYELGQNYPNPFNPRTTIKYALPLPGEASLAVFDALGRRVAVLRDGVQPAGYHEVVFEAGMLPSGVYIYVLRAEGFVQSRTLVLLR